MSVRVNRFDYPFAYVMYEPVLKVRVGIEPGRDTDIHNVAIGIHYDPEIRDGYYFQKAPDEEQKILMSHPATAALATRPMPFKSDSSLRIANLRCHWEMGGATVRLKILDEARIFLSYEFCEKVRSLGLPGISSDLFGFYRYVIENYIGLAGLERDFYPAARTQGAIAVEICLNESAFSEAFGLSADDYDEVEPGWFALTRRSFIQ